jgi:SAM-dependent methyltransferase
MKDKKMNKKKFLMAIVFWGLAGNYSIAKMMTEADIRKIYETYVAVNFKDEYVKRYEPLPLEKNNVNWQWENKDFPRVISLLEFDHFVRLHKISCKKGLAMNGLDPEWQYLPAEKIVRIDYDTDHDRYDLHSLNLTEDDFDFVMVNQTLEHLYDPIRCLENIYKHMRKGGMLYLNAPANGLPHEDPFHYYTGFTATGLGVMLELAGFKLLSVGQWGNIEYIKKMFETNSWLDYKQLKNPGKNDMYCPVIVWAFAVKN